MAGKPGMRGLQKLPVKKLTFFQLCYLVAGIVLASCFLLALLYDGSLARIAVWLGLGMMLSGAMNLLAYIKGGKEAHGRQWLFAEGLTAILLSLFPMFNQMIQVATLPFFFGMWELFSGILRTAENLELRRENIKGWESIRVLAVVELLSGVASLLRPVVDFVGMNVIISLVLAVQSAGSFLKIFSSGFCPTSV